MIIKKVISGGQTGADQAALRAAKRFGLKTGGWMPKGLITQDGPKPEFADYYSMQEDESPKYPPRTKKNVRDSDGTLRIAGNFNSAGEKCTLRFIRELDKPYFDININSNFSINNLTGWIKTYNINILNVAGNSEKTCPRIGLIADLILTNLFMKLKYE